MADRETFHYPLPEDEGPSRWDGLSPAAREAVAATVQDLNPARELLEGETILAPEAAEWAKRGIDKALKKWRKYDGLLGGIPESAEDLASGHPRYHETIARLFGARGAFRASRETDSEGVNISKAMGLVLVPWQNLKADFLGEQFRASIERLRDAQGVAQEDDFINETLLAAMKKDLPLYRDPNDLSTLIKPSEYLEDKISADGPWGIMWAQSSDEAGTKNIDDSSSPNNLTNFGGDHLTIAGQDVDAMGVFEWLGLTFQKNRPDRLSRRDYSWLLANRLLTEAGVVVPSADWDPDDNQAGMYLHDADKKNRRSIPRLAVL